MKKFIMKLSGMELLPDLIMGGFIIIIGGGFLLFRSSQLSLPEHNLQLLKFSAAMIFIIIFLAWLAFYKSAKAWIKWYKKILDYIPVPIIMTDKNANWLQTNEAALKVFNLEKGNAVNMLNSRHLIDEDGNINKKIWTRNGTSYVVTGNTVCYGKKIEGYLLLFYNLHELIDICEPQTAVNSNTDKLLNQMTMTTGYFSNCTAFLNERIKRQSSIISRLTNTVGLLASGKADSGFHKTMESILHDMRLDQEYEEAHSETIRSFMSELAKINETIDNYIRDG